mmetsp:Transcript_4504/g.7996  ORF Transcript_4504/g.7996 Transcript_4504/m.7996 type:complete len:86 (+) Transcript_4504:1223-1480(+)
MGTKGAAIHGNQMLLFILPKQGAITMDLGCESWWMQMNACAAPMLLERGIIKSMHNVGDDITEGCLETFLDQQIPLAHLGHNCDN